MTEKFAILFRLFSKLKRISNVASAKKAGLKVGERTIFVGDQAFGSEPFLIEIGKDCLVTDGVKFITHDGAIQVPLIASGEKIDKVYAKQSTFARIKIGDNVFIGVSTILLPGVVVGNNSIIAAGSVVKGKFPAGVVLGGSPAKVICKIDDYFNRNKINIVIFTEGFNRRQEILDFLD